MYHNRLIHDRLSEVNTPMYFSDFIGKAEAHGLNYLAEADFSEMNDLYFPQAVREMLLRISGDDILVKEQLADFLKGRKFRRTLLCHAEVSLNRNLHSNFMENFFFSCPAKPEDENGQILKLPFSELLARKNTGLSRDGSVLNTDNTAVRAALFHLSDIYPAALHFRELLELGQKYGTLSPGEESAALCEALMSGFSGSLIELYAYPRNFAREPGDYPVASRLARLQVRTGSKVTNLCHQTLELENTYGLFLLPLLDGTRSRRTIEEESLNIIRSGNIPLNGKFPYEKTEGELIAEINEELINCAKFGLLSA